MREQTFCAGGAEDGAVRVQGEGEGEAQHQVGKTLCVMPAVLTSSSTNCSFCAARTTPDIYITQKSTPTEVRNWLKAKQFGDRLVQCCTQQQ